MKGNRVILPIGHDHFMNDLYTRDKKSGHPIMYFRMATVAKQKQRARRSPPPPHLFDQLTYKGVAECSF